MKDHLGREIGLAGLPRRLVSLVPSITETLVALGARERLAGRTSFCVHPTLPEVAVVGGTKTPELEKIRALAPDLVLANKEENREAHVLELARTLPVFVTDVSTIAGARAWTDELAALLDGQTVAARRTQRVARGRGTPGLALVWRRPFLAVGEDTYAADVLAAAGVRNVVTGDRYPRLELDELVALAPETIVLPTEPYPWTAAEARELEAELAARGVTTRCSVVPGEALTWWGARTPRAVEEVRAALAGAGNVEAIA